ncbi:MAG TPA: tetratricopeptide repeat protein [Polyangiaceae bacterium]|nr:tetratricopeptide repeat protein [Polyangiaceae bacterium]
MDSATAEAKFNAALRLFKAGKMADALPVFREIAEGNGSPNARLYIGHCLQQLGKYVEAHKAFTAVVKQTTQRGDTKYEPTREAALAQLGLLEPRIAKVVVSLVEVPAGLAVTLDGATVEEKDLGSPVVVEPGAHKIEGTATDMAPVRREISVEPGESKTTILTFKKLEAAPAPSPSEAPPKPESAPSQPFPLRTVGLVAGGVGVAGLTVFTVAGLMAKSTFNRMSDECGASGCSDAAQLGEIDKGRSQQTLANVGIVVGLVGLSAGAALVILGGRSHGNDAPATVAVSGVPGGGAVSYTGKF